jgi:hypothetical protein
MLVDPQGVMFRGESLSNSHAALTRRVFMRAIAIGGDVSYAAGVFMRSLEQQEKVSTAVRQVRIFQGRTAVVKRGDFGWATARPIAK